VISLHVGGMYLTAPISGWLADRAGRLPVLGAAGTLFIGAGVLAALLPGHETALMALALLLLGAAWNLGLVGGSALLTDAIEPERRPQAQGASDLVMGMTGAVGSLSAGPVFQLGAFALLGVGAVALGVALIVLAVRAAPALRAGAPA